MTISFGGERGAPCGETKEDGSIEEANINGEVYTVGQALSEPGSVLTFTSIGNEGWVVWERK